MRVEVIGSIFLLRLGSKLMFLWRSFSLQDMIMSYAIVEIINIIIDYCDALSATLYSFFECVSQPSLSAIVI
jgi:hypothetical protein